MKHISILLSILSFNLLGQQANYWFFGSQAGLNFNTNPPTILQNGTTIGPDNSSTISDSNGNLLFYTDGLNVKNSLHATMPNGSGLIGHGSGGQCALIVPIPCSSTKYVIFHTTEFSSPGHLHYTVVDMALNSGLGDVVAAQKNISLGTSYTEKLCAIYNPAGNFYWVLTHKWGNNQFVAFKVDANTIATQSVTTSIGSPHTCGTYGGAHDAMGQLTISRDGSTVVNALTCQDVYELFQFNMTTGLLSNMISLPGGGNAWGTAFSPDSKKLYTNSIFGNDVFQYDLNVYAFNNIFSSKVSLLNIPSAGYNFGYMELGPDNKLYVSRPSQNVLAVINNPNSSGMNSNPVLNGQSLGNKFSTHGISRIAYNIPAVSSGTSNLSVVSLTGNYTICNGQSLTLLASGAPSYTWSTNSTSSSITISPPTNTVISVQASGGTCSANSIVQVTVSVYPNPTINTIGTNTLCTRTTITITASGADTYQWSSGHQGAQIIVLPLATTVYTVTGTNTLSGCSASAIHLVSVSSTPTLSIFGTPVACIGSQVTYSALGATVLNWSSGGTGPVTSFIPVAPGLYTLTGINGGLCQASSTFSINLVECLGLEEAKRKSEFSLFPSPVTTELNIILPFETQVEEISIYDMMGKTLKVIQDLRPVDSKVILDLSDLKSGVYLLRVQSGTRSSEEKFIKQ